MIEPTFQDIQNAADRLAGVANRTPVLTSRTLDKMTGQEVFLKAENFQRIGAFKFRGAYNALAALNDEERGRGVVAFSSGNHAQAVALAAQIFGIPATIVMPNDAPEAKVAGTAGYGATIVRYDRHTEDREAVANQVSADSGATIVPPFDHPDVIAGQGTATLELLTEVPDIDLLVVCVGGGGLIAGSSIAARHLNPNILICGVEPEDANDTALSFAGGKRVNIAPPATIADGLRATTPGELTFSINRRLVNGIVTVSETAIGEALRFALFRLKILLEPSGAVSLAAVMSGAAPKARRVGVILSGGNIDPSTLAELIHD